MPGVERLEAILPGLRVGPRGLSDEIFERLGDQVDIDRRFSRGLADFIRPFHGPTERVDRGSRGGEKLMRLVELPRIERGDSLGSSPLVNPGKFQPPILPDAVAERPKDENRDPGENENRAP